MTIRGITDADWARVGQLGEVLIQAHHRFDGSRFLHPDALRAEAYVRHLRGELERGEAMVHVADEGGLVIGYVFAGIEPESWKELRHRAGFIHDLVVDEAHRGAGAGRALVASAIDWFTARGVRRVMLWSAHSNVDAQRLFQQAGFRPTMIEMTFDAE
jgi:GNAT superfamily N-acetyltransferase